jgi:hypothetical protein
MDVARPMRIEILLIPLSLAIALVAAEGLLRAFPMLLPLELQIALEDSPETRGISHPYIGNLHTPSGTLIVRTSEFEIPYPTDRHGFNNADPWPATADIVAVGDSLTFGYGVTPDEAWPALIARKLPNTKVINLGLIGAGPQQHLRIYETFGVPLEPRILLIGFFPANDFWDAEMFEAWLKSGVGGNYMVWRDFGRDSGEQIASLRGALRTAISTIGRASFGKSTGIGGQGNPKACSWPMAAVSSSGRKTWREKRHTSNQETPYSSWLSTHLSASTRSRPAMARA